MFDEPTPPSRPLWRRRGLLGVLAAGLGLLLVLAGVTAWLFLRAPGGKDHSGDLHRFLLAPPAGAHVLPFSVTDDPSPNARPGVLSSVAETWSVGNRAVSIGLDRYNSTTAAQQAAADLVHSLPQDLGKFNTASIPDVPGAVLLHFGDPNYEDINVVGVRGDVRFFISTVDSVDVGDRLAKAQYDLL